MRPFSILLYLSLMTRVLVVPVPGLAIQIDPENPLPDTGRVGVLSVERTELDREVQGELTALFRRVPGMERVEVRVEAGVAFLSGAVLSLDNREMAEALTRGAAGILYVDNRIREETSLRNRLRPMRDRTVEKIMVAMAYAPLLLMAAALVVLFFLLGSVVSRWDPPYLRISSNPFLQNLLRQLFGLSVGLAGVLLALELLDVTTLVGAVLGAAGVAGVAVGFAFRNIAENYLAGILLSLRQPFAPDDQILVEGQEGKVIRLTSRETILMTLDGNHVRIPNATIFNSIVLNYTRNPLRRFRFDISVGQDQDLLRVQELGLEALRGLGQVLADPPPRATIVEIGDSWILLRFFGWTDQRKVGFDKIRSEAIRLVFQALDRGGVRMPAPEYGLRFLSSPAERGGPFAEEAIPEEGAAPAPAGELRDSPLPVPGTLPDLSPDRELDQQIARDRRGAEEKDLLNTPGTETQG